MYSVQQSIKGVVSRIDVDAHSVLRIQIDAAINPGNRKVRVSVICLVNSIVQYEVSVILLLRLALIAFTNS